MTANIVKLPRYLLDFFLCCMAFVLVMYKNIRSC